MKTNFRKLRKDLATILFLKLTLNISVQQVIDLSEIPPEVALEFCKLLPDVQWRILVCGGDGTIGWVLNAIDSIPIKVSNIEFID